MKRTKHILHLPSYSPLPPFSRFVFAHAAALPVLQNLHALLYAAGKKWNNSSALFYLLHSRHAIKINYIAYTRGAQQHLYLAQMYKHIKADPVFTARCTRAAAFFSPETIYPAQRAIHLAHET
jgi:hypothetical protein